MHCPFCNTEMTQYAHDTGYRYFKCKNPKCKDRLEYMQPKDDPGFEQADNVPK